MDFPYIGEQEVEIVERKGIGHPDTMCDNIAENLSIELSRYYYENFGKIYHHNVDKAVLIGGRAVPKFGGGELLEPIEIKVVGRAILEVSGKEIPIREIYEKSVKSFIKNNFKVLDPENHIKLEYKLRPGSIDLIEVFNRRNSEVPEANDTSFGVGYAPFSKLESIVYGIERLLYSLRENHPFIGEDIKVMGVRLKNHIKITIALAFIDKYVENIDDYIEKKKLIKDIILYNFGDEIEVFINTADNFESGVVYITTTGTSAEAGDDGQVGRGNRINGLITPYRPMSLEAPAGKNPISHVGKLYNITANRLANEIVNSFDEVIEAYVYIVSQIGKPITQPQILNIKLRTKNNKISTIRENVERLSRKYLESITELWKEILYEKIEIC
ncbi:MAG: methionine adenosyltransferase [candidate division WOR-3 bacterium]|nr:methionine adenosyltransferase [candidate division WOR-3 bacterium]MCX7947342.1 methionine adenosyltransferase [candidate division WOR-3 bacterium]MDW8150102.1 methionine adenosyltransferase [candidate division WOR-3 bacterium]